MSVKTSILIALEGSRDAAVSGQALAEQLGVSRNAVWKAVNALRAEGYAIESTQNRGYRLSPIFDRISENGVRALLADAAVPIFYYDTVDSTMSQSKRLLVGGEAAPFAVIAGEQTAGRGRQGRAFYSPKDAGLYLTVALAPGQAIAGALGVTAYAAVCVADAVLAATGLQPRIKWVNDLYLNGRKVCGILTEATTDLETGTVESLLIGVGLNLRASDVPEPLRDIVGFLHYEAPVKNRLAAEIIKGLLRYTPTNAAYLSRYRELSLTLTRRVACSAGGMEWVGVAEAIDESGALLVRDDGGVLHAVRSGEARVLPDPNATAHG